MGGVLAIDYGSKKCGFATTDALGVSLQPLTGLRHEGDESRLLAHLRELLAERDVSVLLVGVPLDPEGRAGERALVVRAFAARLRTAFPALEVAEWSEHLTTREAESRLREQGVRGRDAKAERDSWSALVLLEDWLRSRGGRVPPAGGP
jgi:putative Holliday junction resolvase